LQFIVGGNWKCNGTMGSVKILISELNAGKIDADVGASPSETSQHNEKHTYHKWVRVRVGVRVRLCRWISCVSHI